jgi:hemoglobin/transferrin/lactoferrin receptor protein
MNSHYRIALSAMAACAAFAVFPALAQEAAQDAAPAARPAVIFEPVTVTATKNETKAFDHPGSVAVIGEQQIEDAQPSNLGDLLDGVAGVTLNGGPRSQGETFLIRGLGGDRILLKVDGARRNFTAGHDGRIFIDPDLLKQVDIVRGPASSIHGSGAIGGVMELTTKDAADLLEPGETFGALIKGGYQSAANEKTGRITLFGRVGEHFDVIANGSYTDQGKIGLGDGTALQNSAADERTGFIKFGWMPAPHHSLKLTAHRLDEDARVPVNPQGVTSGTNPAAERTLVQDELNLTYRYRNPDDNLVDFKTTLYANMLEMEENRLTAVQRDVINFDTHGLDLQNTTRITLSENFDNRVVYGVEYYHDQQSGTSNGMPLGSRPSADADSYGVFVQNEITLFEDVTVIPGLRYDNYHRESPGIPDTDESRVSPKIALGWRPLNWFSLHGAYSQAFRAPGFIELYVTGLHFFGNTFIPNPNLKPETAETLEGGFGLRFHDVLAAGDDVRFKATYFDETVENFIELIVTATTSTNMNRAKVNRRGLEAEFGYATENFSTDLGYSAIRAEDAADGDSIDSTPADALSLRLGYGLPDHDLRLRWITRAAWTQDYTPLDMRTGGYVTHGFGATWEPDFLPGGRLDFAVDNMLDKSYTRHNAAIPEAGRNFRITWTQRL